MSEQQERATVAKTWSVEPGVGLVIDGRTFPWWVAADPGPMVEPLDGLDVHILWLPVFVEGDIPQYGRPDATPTTHPSDTYESETA